eukprot:CAMPEP_0204539008 /NCGR_PEP_ID=MMETSP0661-20131031/16422_1 /ASSEMBLY_ACC=CAM_ASM_000606 /TAXON_ID=109239 /ORGANISM="Alexandrium margalefi, Strain AMGDE01CS-322" /LENGTH=133 /DNA_ID=CAMNT_0051545609 /DNA_START=80 /DNA_END=479 /DNA_ORIENTATION=+
MTPSPGHCTQDTPPRWSLRRKLRQEHQHVGKPQRVLAQDPAPAVGVGVHADGDLAVLADAARPAPGGLRDGEWFLFIARLREHNVVLARAELLAEGDAPPEFPGRVGERDAPAQEDHRVQQQVSLADRAELRA